MPISGISGSPSVGIDQILAQIRNVQARTQSPSLGSGGSGAGGNGAGVSGVGLNGLGTNAAGKVGQPNQALNALRNNALGISGGQGVAESAPPQGSFLSSLKASLDQVNTNQNKASDLGKAFEKGDPNVDLNDVMVAVQKASVSFQSAVQVRNRMVSAYHDIMNMQI